MRQVPRSRLLLDRPSLKNLFADADQAGKARRNQLIRRDHLQCSHTLSEVVAYLDIHYTIVSEVVNEKSEN